MTKTKKVQVLFLILAISVSLISAEEAVNKRTGQLSFFYPMGTNGAQAMEYSNSYSLNIVFGMNGGVDAFELGGVGNYNSGDVRGVQIAGVSNINMGETSGFQLAGVTNTNLSNSSGLIWSGTLNTVFGNSRGVMISNINVTSGEMKGLQVGTVNYAAKSEGVQLGLINVAAEGADSLPIGLINYVKDGYFAVEASAGEILYGNVRYKMGVERFYTIFSAGSTVDERDPVFSYGLGWGTLIPLAEGYKLVLEATCNEILYDYDWDEGVNLLNKLDMNLQIAMGDHLSLFAGPSFNVYVTDEEDHTLTAPYTFFDEMYDETRVQMWVGANAGLTYRF